MIWTACSAWSRRPPAGGAGTARPRPVAAEKNLANVRSVERLVDAVGVHKSYTGNEVTSTPRHSVDVRQGTTFSAPAGPVVGHGAGIDITFRRSTLKPVG